MTNYTLADTGHVLMAFALFSPFLLFPGYVLGWASDALQFRSRSLGERLIVAIPFSISTVPLLIYLTGLGSLWITWGVLGTISALFMVLFARDLRRRRMFQERMRVFLLFAACWLAIGLVSLIDYQWDDQLFIPTTGYDYTTRVAVTAAVGRTGVAPANPFFFPGYTVPLRYHHFWLLPASLASQLAGGVVTPGQATIAGTLWCGLGLMALVVIYVLYFQNAGREGSPQRAWIGIALLAVTGLDIIPMLFHLVVFNAIPFTVDSWNEVIAGWMSSLLWVPHHVAAAIACLSGFLVLWTGASRTSAVRLWSVAIAGAAFACAAGLSVYVCFAFSSGLLAYGVVALRKHWRDDALAIAGSGAIAAALAFPFLFRTAAAAGSKTGPAFISLTVRTFTFPEDVMIDLHAHWILIKAVNLVLLPLNYTLELGLFLLVGIVQARRYARRRASLGRREWAEIALVALPVLVCTFLRSGVINNNDLGWRGFLIAQFMLVLWSIPYVRVAARAREWSNSRATAVNRMLRLRILIALAAGLGFAGTLYGLLIGRAYLPVLQAGWLNRERSWFRTPDLKIGQRMLGRRNADEWIRTRVARDAVVLQNPGIQDVEFGLYANHQMVATGDTCGTVFGGPLEACREVLAVIQPVYEAAPSVPADIDSVCRRYSIRAILVTDADPVWRDPHSWVRTRLPDYANPFSKVFKCGTDSASRRAGEPRVVKSSIP
ncbi:MAG TPA: hypothetical protein VGR73_14645 [Bryobacteraceae bacterium]|nr:hypothetical protein [Bryobacteraceae bacterium]